MLVILKRGGILFCLITALVMFIIFTLYLPRTERTAGEKSERVIVIDPGHGAPDGGAVGTVTGVLEKDLNLDIGQRVFEKLQAEKYAATLTRKTDAGLYEKEAASIREKKRADMKNRVRLANRDGVGMLISIHMNFFTDAKYSGPQVFYREGSEEGERLASAIRLAFLEEIGPHCTREIKPRTDLYLLEKTKVPAVIVECGFLSNPEEEALLSEDSYREALATAICRGIQNYQSEA